jgi:hypothetical protein
MGPPKTRCRVTIELSRPLNAAECEFFQHAMDEWLFNAFQDWDDLPFREFRLDCPVMQLV